MTTKLNLSCEVYPPKGDDFNKKLNELSKEIEKLLKYNLSLISVTYGAGGSNRERSFQVIQELLKLNTNIMPHFTCVCSSKEFIEKYLDEIKKLKITNILALRGDEPQDINVCYKDFTYAFELVKYLKENSNFEIAVAGYPEKHPRAKTIEDDIKNLKKKIDLGAKRIYTQLFFDNTHFYNFLNLCQKNDINVPISAGIMPVTNYKQIEKMTSMCGSSIPNKLLNILEKYKDNKEDTEKAGLEWTIKQCQDLIKNNVLDLHFYTLNKAKTVSKILDNIL